MSGRHNPEMDAEWERQKKARPLLLDLFCGAGGAAMGYYRAGFDVVGVDIKPQPHYPFEFVQSDALVFAERLAINNGWRFDAVHASPPCQAFTQAKTIHPTVEHPDLLTPTRALLDLIGLPYVIENVPNAPMRPDFVLCGSAFGEPRLRRHRWFEVNWDAAHLMAPCGHSDQLVSVFGHGGHRYHGVGEWREVMGIDWMTRDELAQAVPPSYTQFIGLHLLDQMARVA